MNELNSMSKKRKVGLYFARRNGYSYREIYKEVRDIETDNEEVLIMELEKRVSRDETRFVRG